MLAYDIAPMAEDERNYVRSSWLHNSCWQRADMERRLRSGKVLVARADGTVLGWVCSSGEKLCHLYVRERYRELGVEQALWAAAGSPREHAREAVAVTSKHAQDMAVVARRQLRALIGGR